MSDSAVFMAPIPVTPAIPALISRLVEQFDATWIDADNLDAWLAEGATACCCCAVTRYAIPNAWTWPWCCRNCAWKSRAATN